LCPAAGSRGSIEALRQASSRPGPDRRERASLDMKVTSTCLGEVDGPGPERLAIDCKTKVDITAGKRRFVRTPLADADHRMKVA
jgi:hypothetical protein